MARLYGTLVLLLLFSCALSFRISKHRVHEQEGQHPGPGHPSAGYQPHPDPKPAANQLEDPENAIPEDIEFVIPEYTDSSEVKSKENIKEGNQEIEDANQVDLENKNQEYNEDSTQEDTEENNHEGIQQDIESTGQEDTEDKTQVESEAKYSKNSEHRKLSIVSQSHKAKAEVQRKATVYAFDAELSSNVQIGPGSIIMFDNVLVNEGGLYYETSGQFACSDEGVYVFMWSLRTYSGTARGLSALALGGTNIKSGPQTSYYTSSTNYNGNSQMVSVVQCRTSPITAVTVRSMFSSPPTYSAGHTSFSGFRLSPDAAGAVAFTAELSSDVSLFPGSRIMFDNVVSNLGGHYDNRNGFFRCPDNGIYSFTVSTYYPKASNMWSVSRLMFDGISVVQGPMTHRAATSTGSGSSSVTVLTQCLQDKDIYVEAEQSYTFDFTEYGADLTSFSGFRLCSECNDLVAFSAVLMQNTTGTLADIRFGNVLLTRGNAYNHMTGVFTCPNDAFYMFQWSATSVNGLYELNLYVNGLITRRNYMTYQSTSDSSGTSGTSSQSAVIRCNPGDTVSLRVSSTSTSRILLAGYSTFSGYRLPGQ